MRIDAVCAGKFLFAFTCVACALVCGNDAVAQQRVLGVDISYWNTGNDQNYHSDPQDIADSGIAQEDWNLGFSSAAGGGNRKYVWIRATRGGTTGLGQTSGTPPTHNSGQETLSRRYDDPRFLQNIKRATNAGFFSGTYHFARPDIPGNTGANEADHFLEMAGVYMRPGFMLPVFDLEAGDGSSNLAQFSIDFSNRLYEKIGIRPGMYINGNHTSHLEASSTAAQDHLLAQPVSDGPSMVGPAFPMLWNARYANQGAPNTIPVQTGSPKHTPTTVNSYYGPWDNYGDTQPWSFWQYASTNSIPGFNAVDAGIDGNVSHGDMEYVKDYLVPAVWWGDNNGDWSTPTNWNSGQPIQTFSGSYPAQGFVDPHIGAGQAPQFETDPLVPAPRLPGAAGSGINSGANDTVILERPNADVTVTVSLGSHNIRKLYVRETLNINGGSLTINYDPTYRPDTSTSNLVQTVRHGGPISAQFSGAVTLSAGALNVHTARVDSNRTFTLSGGALTFNRVELASHATTPAKILMNGEVIFNPMNNATATIANHQVAGNSGFVDLGGGAPTFIVNNGSAAVDLSVNVPIVNGGIVKSGLGTMLLNANNTFTGPVTVNQGAIRYGHASGLSSSSVVAVNDGGTLDMNGISDTIAALSSAAGQNSGQVLQGAASLTVGAASGSHSFSGVVTGTGAFNKTGGATQILSGSNLLGPVNVNAGSLLFNGTSSAGAVTVGNGGTLGGTGAVLGAVTLNSGGHLSPGASTIDTFDIGSLTLNAGSVLDIELGAFQQGDRINFQSGLLAMNGGSVNILDPDGQMSPGNYTILDYGTRTGSIASLGTPTGPDGFNFSLIDTGSLVRLVVTEAPIGVVGDFTNDGVVDIADYIMWSKVRDTMYDLPNDDDLAGPIGDGHLQLWRQGFGHTWEGNGGGTGNGVVPEPSTVVCLMLGIAALFTGRRRCIR